MSAGFKGQNYLVFTALADKIFLRVFIHTFAGCCQKLKPCRAVASFTFVSGEKSPGTTKDTKGQMVMEERC
jgi:hypothetical protein